MFIRLFFMLFYIFSISRVKKRERETAAGRRVGQWPDCLKEVGTNRGGPSDLGRWTTKLTVARDPGEQMGEEVLQC